MSGISSAHKQHLIPSIKHLAYALPITTYLPGTTFYEYTITDLDTGLNASAYVHIIIDPPVVAPVAPPSPPVALDDFYYCPFNLPCSPGVILANDSSPTGGILTVAGVETYPPVGALDPSENGSFVYLPPP